MRIVLYIAILFGIAGCNENSTESPSDEGKSDTPNNPKPSTKPSDEDDKNQPLLVVQNQCWGIPHLCLAQRRARKMLGWRY